MRKRTDDLFSIALVFTGDTMNDVILKDYVLRAHDADQAFGKAYSMAQNDVVMSYCLQMMNVASIQKTIENIQNQDSWKNSRSKLYQVNLVFIEKKSLSVFMTGCTCGGESEVHALSQVLTETMAIVPETHVLLVNDIISLDEFLE